MQLPSDRYSPGGAAAVKLQQGLFSRMHLDKLLEEEYLFPLSFLLVTGVSYIMTFFTHFELEAASHLQCLDTRCNCLATATHQAEQRPLSCSKRYFLGCV